MSRTSNIKRLPNEVKNYLNAILRESTHTQSEATDLINDQLKQLGLKPVSKSCVSRYAKKMGKIGKEIKQAREVADIWIHKLGSVPGGKVGHLLIEIIRNMAFDQAITKADAGEVDMKLIKDLAVAIERLERASMESVKRESEVKKQIKEDLEREITGNKKLDPQAISEVMRAVYGICK